MGELTNTTTGSNSKLNDTLEPTQAGLCDRCRHRADSIANCKEYLATGKTGMICDPAPKYECKQHKLYGREDYQKKACSDFEPMFYR